MAKIALITGGMGGIGTEMCKTLYKSGYTVITTYINDEATAQEWLTQRKDEGYAFKAYKCDVSIWDSASACVTKIRNEVGKISILVNNAGITRDASLKKMTPENWDKVLKTNLYGIFNMSKQVIDDMVEQRWGRIINISSINGQKGQFGQVNYSAAKSGIHGFTMALAQEVATKGVTVNTIAPGYIATDMVMTMPEEIRAKIISQIPLSRLGKPEEIAALVDYLASELSAFMTGAELAINGGQHMM